MPVGAAIIASAAGSTLASPPSTEETSATWRTGSEGALVLEAIKTNNEAKGEGQPQFPHPTHLISNEQRRDWLNKYIEKTKQEQGKLAGVAGFLAHPRDANALGRRIHSELCWGS